MSEQRSGSHPNSTDAAIAALQRGYTPIPITGGGKRPWGGGWERTRWPDEQKMREAFAIAQAEGATNIGLLLGAPSNGLVDVDLDHPLAWRMRPLLPPTLMVTGRAGARFSHYWYVVHSDMPEGTRRYKMPDGSTSVELRTTGGQTVIPPSIHPSGERYLWDGEPWGGEVGPAVVDGKRLSVQVATLALNSILLENWPTKGGRHDAYLALAGWLLRSVTDGGVHPWWERNIAGVILPLADASHDEDGGDTRLHEAVRTTAARLRNDQRVHGLPTLARIIGDAHASQAERMRRDVEMLAGNPERAIAHLAVASESDLEPLETETGPPPERWARTALDRWIDGDAEEEVHDLLIRSDGVGLWYRGLVNMVIGPSEQGKTWLTLMGCCQEIAKGGRVLFIDLEDGPKQIVRRLRLLRLPADDIRHQFAYIQPESPLGSMFKRPPWEPTKAAPARLVDDETGFIREVSAFDPTLIIVDGTTALLRLHALSPNDATDVDLIRVWLESLTNEGRRTVVIVDHTRKGGDSDSDALGSQHKKAMVRGTQLNVTARGGYLVKGQRNVLYVTSKKDKQGEVREHGLHGTPMHLAEVILDTSDPDDVVWLINLPNAHAVDVDGHGVSTTDWRGRETSALALFKDDLDGEHTIADLMSATGLSRNVCTQVWDRLVRAKYTERVPGISQGKPARWRLTPDGKVAASVDL